LFENLLILATFALALVIAIYTAWMLSQQPHRRATLDIDLPSGIPVSEIGFVERDLVNLQSVTVVADKVERPTTMLQEAVEHNFRRGVKYLFLVSSDHADQQVDGYYRLFEALAQIVLNKQGVGIKQDVRALVDIQQLPYDWNDFPYIFYEIKVASGHTKTLAFRGDQVHKGIAHHNCRVDPASAHTIARAIFSEAPRSVRQAIEREQFNADPYVKLMKPSAPPIRTTVQ
jgi:hypothetical protein